MSAALFDRSARLLMADLQRADSLLKPRPERIISNLIDSSSQAAFETRTLG